MLQEALAAADRHQATELHRVVLALSHVEPLDLLLTAITVLATGVSSNAGATTQAAQASMFEMKCQNPHQDFKAHGKTMQNDVIFR